jgi:hypothetical protein
LLEDRILLREGKKQIYGSQVRRNEAGEWEAHSLEDPERVDERRASVGLPPLAQYLAGFAERSGGTVANRTKDAPRADAPPLRQDLFSAADDARAAYEKLQKVRPASFAERRTLILACHDFCRRFPEHSLYGAVVVLAVRTTSFLPAEERRDLGDWDPAAAEQEAKLNAEQRAEVALTLATGRAAEQMRQGGGDWGERQFEALVAVVPPHRATQHARQALLRAALEAPPARAMAVLRELFPGDSTVAAGIQALEQIGRPCELAFTAFDGRPVKTADSRGKVVWVVFWLGAGGVDTTMSKVKELAERHGPADLAVVGVSFDRNREVVQETIDRHRLTWPVHFDGRGWSSELGSRFQIRVLPAYLLIDREGILRFRGGSPTTVGAMARIDQLLAEKPPAR